MFWLCHVASGIFVPRPEIEHIPPALEAQSLNHWATREVPEHPFLADECVLEVGEVGGGSDGSG